MISQYVFTLRHDTAIVWPNANNNEKGLAQGQFSSLSLLSRSYSDDGYGYIVETVQKSVLPLCHPRYVLGNQLVFVESH